MQRDSKQTIQILVQSETFCEGNTPCVGQRVTGWLLKAEWLGDCQCDLSWAERRKQPVKNWGEALPADGVATAKARKRGGMMARFCFLVSLGEASRREVSRVWQAVLV